MPVYSNLFTVFAGDKIVQIEFKNQLGLGGEQERVSIVALERSNAEALYKLLGETLKIND